MMISPNDRPKWKGPKSYCDLQIPEHRHTGARVSWLRNVLNPLPRPNTVTRQCSNDQRGRIHHRFRRCLSLENDGYPFLPHIIIFVKKPDS